MKILVVLSNDYPYAEGTGEIYLNIEVPILSRIYDKVIVLCTDNKSKKEILSEENVKTFYRKDYKSKITIRQYALMRAFGSYVHRDYRKYNAELVREYEQLDSCEKKIIFYYFNIKAQRKYEQFKDVLDNELKNCSVLHIYSYRFYDLSKFAILIAQDYKNSIKSVKCITRAHRYDLYSWANRQNYIPDREYLLKNLDMILPCSKDGEEYLHNLYPKYKTKIKASYLGSKDNGVQSFEIKQKRIELISCSNIIPVKRVMSICKAVKKLRDLNIDVRWTHIGEGKDRNQIEKYCKRNQLSGFVNLIGRLSHREVIENYRRHHYDLFINVSESEGIPQAIMEAISFGIPVIATNVGGNKEIVINGEKNRYKWREWIFN